MADFDLALLLRARSRVKALHDAGALRFDPDRGDLLRRRVRTGTRVALLLDRLAESERAALLAALVPERSCD